MANQILATSHVHFQIDTKDSTLPEHTDKKMCVIPPNADGTEGAIGNKVEYPFTAVAGLSGTSAAKSDPVLLIPGVYKYWCESDNPDDMHMVSPAFHAFVDALGTVRPHPGTN